MAKGKKTKNPRNQVVSIALTKVEKERIDGSSGPAPVSVHARELALEGLMLRELAREDNEAAKILGWIRSTPAGELERDPT